MSKKKLYLIPAVLLALTVGGLTSCGPSSTDPTTVTSEEVTVSGVVINNLKVLQEQDYYVGQTAKSAINFSVEYSDGSKSSSSNKVTITSSDETIATIDGKNITGVKAGNATITVTSTEDTSKKASFDITVKEFEYIKEKAVTITELLNIEANTYTAYTFTGKITGYASGKTDFTQYGNFYIADPADETKSILVYGSTATESALAYNETTHTWSFSNPKDFQTNSVTKDIKIGDTVSMKAFRLDYNTTKEVNGLITSVTPKQDDPVTTVTITAKPTNLGNGYTYTMKAKDNNEYTNKVSWSITSGDAATIDASTGVLTADATKTGTVTVKATSTVNTEISATVDVEVVAVPAIIEGKTLSEVIADESGNGKALYKVTGVRVKKNSANSSGTTDDNYGNFDYVDGTDDTVTITSYGLSKNASTVRYYNSKFNFSNDKSFQSTGVKVPTDDSISTETYDVIVMRSDYTKDGVTTKQLVGYLYSDEPVVEDVTNIADLQKNPSTTIEYTSKGVVVATTTKGFVLRDGTGSVYVYQNAAPTVEEGDYVKVVGVVSAYSGVYQFTNTAVVTALTEEKPVLVDNYVAYTGADFDTWYDATSRAVGVQVQFKGIINKSGNYYNVDLGASKVQGSLVYPNSTISGAITSGKAYTIKGYLMYTSGSTTKYANIIVTSVVEAEYDAVASLAVSDETLSLTAGDEKSITTTVLPVTANQAVTLTSNNEAAVTIKGKVLTAVAAGEATITVTTAGLDSTGVALIKPLMLQ